MNINITISITTRKTKHKYFIKKKFTEPNLNNASNDLLIPFVTACNLALEILPTKHKQNYSYKEYINNYQMGKSINPLSANIKLNDLPTTRIRTAQKIKFNKQVQIKEIPYLENYIDQESYLKKNRNKNLFFFNLETNTSTLETKNLNK